MEFLLFVVLPFALLFTWLRFVVWKNTPDWRDIPNASHEVHHEMNTEILDYESAKTRNNKK